jgi:hypothetical protein
MGNNRPYQFRTILGFPADTLGRSALRFQGVVCFKKWMGETVVCVFSADPSLIVASCDSRVILQSLIRRLIPDFCRSMADSLAFAISVVPPILWWFPELPLPLIQLSTSVLGVVKCLTFTAGTFPQDRLHALLLVFVKNHGWFNVHLAKGNARCHDDHRVHMCLCTAHSNLSGCIPSSGTEFREDKLNKVTSSL